MYYENLLLEYDLIAKKSSDTISEDAMLLGRDVLGRYDTTLDEMYWMKRSL